MPTPVLLVDDDEFARSFIRTVLERAGYEVHESEDVATALATAQHAKPHAVVTDWNLPDGNGGHLARVLRSGAANLPVILITGDAPESDTLLNESSREFTAVIQKPFAPSVLENAIHAATRR